MADVAMLRNARLLEGGPLADDAAGQALISDLCVEQPVLRPPLSIASRRITGLSIYSNTSA